jgi:uncharacterized LabA/DUF88 family protein
MNTNPDFFRWMLFVDGENFALQAEKRARAKGLELKEGAFYIPEVFVWMPTFPARENLYSGTGLAVYGDAIRAHYYTSCVGDDQKILNVRETLHGLGFHPSVFKKPQGKPKSKGVDITLTKDMLSHAFLDNYHIAVLIAGDADYVPLVQEVQRRGKVVYVAFFGEEQLGLSKELKLTADGFYELDRTFQKAWNRTP